MNKKIIFPTVISSIFGFVTALYWPYLSPYVRDMGVAPLYISLMFSVFPLASILVSPIIGSIADNIGRKRIILFGIILQMAALILYLSLAHPLLILLARFFDAIAVAAVLLMGIAKVNDFLEDKHRGKYQGIFLALESLGKIMGPLAGAFLIDRLFIQAPFLTSLGVCIALFVSLLFWKSHHKARLQKKDFNFFTSIKKFLEVKKLRAMAILGFVMHAKQPLLSVFLPLFIIDELGGSYQAIGIVFFSAMVMHLFQFWPGVWADRMGRIRLALIGCLITAGCAIWISQVQTISTLIIIALVYSVGSSIWNVTAWTLMSDIGESLNREGAVVGSYMSLAKTGAFISFLVSGFIVAAYSIRTLFIINGLFVILGVIIALPFFMAKQKIGGVKV